MQTSVHINHDLQNITITSDKNGIDPLTGLTYRFINDKAIDAYGKPYKIQPIFPSYTISFKDLEKSDNFVKISKKFGPDGKQLNPYTGDPFETDPTTKELEIPETGIESNDVEFLPLSYVNKHRSFLRRHVKAIGMGALTAGIIVANCIPGGQIVDLAIPALAGEGAVAATGAIATEAVATSAIAAEVATTGTVAAEVATTSVVATEAVATGVSVETGIAASGVATSGVKITEEAAGKISHVQKLNNFLDHAQEISTKTANVSGMVSTTVSNLTGGPVVIPENNETVIPANNEDPANNEEPEKQKEVTGHGVNLIYRNYTLVLSILVTIIAIIIYFIFKVSCRISAHQSQVCYKSAKCATAPQTSQKYVT